MTRQRAEKIGCIIVFLLGAFIVWQSYQLKTHSWGGIMTDIALWPKIIGFILLAASPVVWWQSGKKRNEERENQETLDRRIKTKMILFMIISFVYTGLLPFLGYLFGTLLWVMSMARLAGEKRWAYLILSGLAITFAGYYFFWRILYIPLPIGTVERVLGLDFVFYGN